MVLAVGAPAPGFELPSGAGSPVGLADLTAGGPAVLAFFKTTCPTCVMAFPVVAEMARRFGAEVPVAAVSQNDLATAGPWLADKGFSGPVLDDEAGGFEASNAYGVRSVPTIFLVGGDGVVLDSFEGWNRDRMNELTTTLAGLTGREPLPVSTADDGRPHQKPG